MSNKSENETNPVSPETITTSSLPPGSRLGVVSFRVRNLDQSIIFWRDVIGLTLINRTDTEAKLGVRGRKLIILAVGALKAANKAALGLYHVAIRIPTRKDFAIAVARLQTLNYRHSPIDHLVTESSYLTDPDGNGIELMFDTFERGHAEVIDGQFQMIAKDGKIHPGQIPLDLPALFSELNESDDLKSPLPIGTDIAHVHLHVSNLEQTMDFYTNIIGFWPHMRAALSQLYDVGLGSNPHAVAFNTWAGKYAEAAQPENAGMSYFTLELPTVEAVDEIKKRLEAQSIVWEQDMWSLIIHDSSLNQLRIQTMKP